MVDYPPAPQPSAATYSYSSRGQRGNAYCLSAAAAERMARLSLPPLMLVMVTQAVSGLDCPAEDWLRYGDQCYLTLNNPPFAPMSWSDAQMACEVIHPGSTLVSIHSDDENERVHHLQV